MSTQIDERVVEMKFDNGRFERGIATTLSTLARLRNGLKLDGAAKGLQNVSTSANNLKLDHLANSVDGIAKKFSTMGVIAITALANIATKAIQVGSQVAKSLTIDPIKQGFEEYQTNLNSVQTILANTQASGATLKDVNDTLAQLNTYSDQTIYNFSQMAKNIGTFTAAGVDLKTSASSIKGIANLAALSGSNSEQASGAMYQLSQAIASGKVSLMDWNSVVNAGMGGATFQRALANTAVAMGKLDKNALKISGSMKNVTIDGQSFRDSISATNGESWLSSDVLTATLGQFTGDLTDAQLAAQGFTAEQIKAIQATAATAKGAATEVKTLTGLMETTKEAVGSGWAQSFQLIFGNFEEAKKNFTGLSKVIGGFVDASSTARNNVLSDWRDLGGQKALWDTIHAAIAAVVSVIKPIKEAFRDIFPAMTGKQLADITKSILAFVKGLKMGEDTAFKVKRIFQGFFAAIDIGRIIIGKIIGVVADLVGALFEGSGGFLDGAAKVGDWVTALRHAIKYGDGLNEFFKKLKDVLLVPIELVRTLARLLGNLFSGGLDTSSMSDAFGRLQDRLEPFKTLGDTIARIWGSVLSRLKDVFSFMQPFAQAVGDAFGKLGEAIQNAISTGDFNGILDAINTGLFGGFIILFKKFMSNGINVDLGGGVLSKIGEAFDGLTGSLKAMQQNLKADTLIKIAGAVALLTVSVVALSLIDSAALTKALVAITVMFTQLAAAMAVMEKISAGGGMIKLGILAGALILVATAIDILTIAVVALSKLSWEELAKGLTAVVVLLGALAGTTQLMAKNSGGMISAGIGLIAISVAIKILASAVKDFASMEWGAMIKGLVGVGAVLTALTIFTRLAAVNKMGIANGAGLILLGVALKIIASAVKDFASMDWGVLLKGFTSMAIALGLIAGAMALLPGPTMLITAAGLVVTAAALTIMAGALRIMGGMSWEEIAKGLVTLAGSLAIIAGAMALMSGALPGAAALIIVAGALAILTPVLIALGGMEWEEIGKGLATLAGVFVVLGLAGLALGPVVPILMGLGVAIALIGAGLALAGGGVFLFATGLTALAGAGAGAAVAITTIVSAIIGLIPMAMKALAEGIKLFAGVIATAGPEFFAAMTTLIGSLLKAINNLAPKIINTLFNLILRLLNTLANNVPKFINAGVRIITGFLNGIANNIGKVVQSATNVVTKFLAAVAKMVPKLVDAGYKMIIDILDGVTKSINNNSEAFGRAGGNLAVAIIRGMVNGIKAGAGQVWQAAQDMASDALNSVKSFLGIASPSKEFTKVGKWSAVGMATGLDKYGHLASNSAEDVGHDVIDSMRKSISGLAEIVSGDIDMQPVIRPVLDLTDIRAGAKGLKDAIPSRLDMKGPISNASTAKVYFDKHREGPEDYAFKSGGGTTVNFTQNNNSPKALSPGEVYRKTNNGVSKIKRELKTSAN